MISNENVQMELVAVEPVAADTNAADTNAADTNAADTNAADTNNAFELALADSSNAAIENELLALNANLSAATYRLLVLIRAFDCRVAWADWAFAPWRTGSAGAAASAWSPRGSMCAWRMHWRNCQGLRPVSLKGASATRRYVP